MTAGIQVGLTESDSLKALGTPLHVFILSAVEQPCEEWMKNDHGEMQKPIKGRVLRG